MSLSQHQLSLFDDDRLTQQETVGLTSEYLAEYFQNYKHVAIAFSGGKDSSATVSTVIHLIESGKVPKPEKLTVVYADTRQELPPLHFSAMAMLREVRRRGFDTKIAVAPIDKRFLVYILGRGVPPPNNNTMRWCTSQIKVDPMMHVLDEQIQNLPEGNRLIMLTGVRLGESAVRDRRIYTSCSKDGGECGQGWFQSSTYDRTDTFAPIIHWRVCHVWEWLITGEIEHGFPTMAVAEAYGGDENLEASARTGCIGCPLASQDLALERVIAMPQWNYLAPLKKLKPIYREMRGFQHRLQKDGTERKKDGSLVKNPCRKGPLKLASRLMFLDRILGIQYEVNAEAIALGRPTINLINDEEENRIRELIALRTFPDKWTGDEPGGEELLPEVYTSGAIQPLLW